MEKKCPQCGATLPTGALAGLCPACLLKEGANETATQPETAAFEPPSIEEIAKLFPQLEILALIGKGGMGAVYKARQPVLDRLVALKILPPQVANGAGFAERFNREARALAKLSHPNIVAVHEFGQVRSRRGHEAEMSAVGKTPPPHVGGYEEVMLPYFIMEFVDGVNLRQLERARKLSPKEALQIVPQICEALQFAHDEGVVHRDIKPENILLDKKGRVKIADFGIAKIMGMERGSPSRSSDESRSASGKSEASTTGESAAGQRPALQELTEAGKVIGTPNYMAPEQMEKPEAVDHRADIFALGVVFYEMLTGELPLGKFTPPSSRIRGVQVDVRLDEVVLRALEKEPERRYQTAEQFKTQVETIATSTSFGSSRRKEAQNKTTGALSSNRIPWSLKIVAALFFVSGCLSVWDTIQGFRSGSHPINTGLLCIPISIGLLRLRNIWRKIAIGLLLLTFALIIFTGLFAMTGHPLPGTVKATFYGLNFSQSPGLQVVFLFVMIVLLGWQYSVLIRPDVKALFVPRGWTETRLEWMVLVLILLALFAVAPVRNAPVNAFQVSGAVSDAATGGPIPNATVAEFWERRKPSNISTSDTQGHYVLQTSRDLHKVQVSAPGYVSEIFSIVPENLPGVAGIYWDFRLQPTNATVVEGREVRDAPFVASLSRGSIELLAVGTGSQHYPDTNATYVWWQPNGTPTNMPGYQNAPGSSASFGDGTPMYRQLIFKTHGLSADASNLQMADCEPAEGYGCGDHAYLDGQWLPDIILGNMELPTNATTVRFKIGVATGPWMKSPPIRSIGQGASGGIRFTQDEVNWNVQVEDIQEANGGTKIIAYHTYHKDWQAELVAEDFSGKEWLPEGRRQSSDGLVHLAGTCRLPISRIKEFHLRFRRYEWVEFRNVALQRNQSTKVTVMDAGMLRTDRQLQSMLNELNELTTKYTDSHPLVQQKRAQIEALQKEIQRAETAPSAN